MAVKTERESCERVIDIESGVSVIIGSDSSIEVTDSFAIQEIVSK